MILQSSVSPSPSAYESLHPRRRHLAMWPSSYIPSACRALPAAMADIFGSSRAVTAAILSSSSSIFLVSAVPTLDLTKQRASVGREAHTREKKLVPFEFSTPLLAPHTGQGGGKRTSGSCQPGVGICPQHEHRPPPTHLLYLERLPAPHPTSIVDYLGGGGLDFVHY
jgi:hypothetical protein